MVHCGVGWDRGQLQAHQHQEGGGYEPGEEDDKGVDGAEEVVEGENDGEHKIVRSIEEVVGESVTDFRYEDGLVVRVEDVTCSQVVSVVEEAGNNKLFINVFG